MHTAPFNNRILKNLPEDAIRRLNLSPIALTDRHELQVPHRSVSQVVFIEEGVISTTVQFEDGTETEVGLDGFESAVGVTAVISSERSFYHVYAQVPGHGLRCSVACAKAEFNRGDAFQTALLRCSQAQQFQAMQSAACNARHSLEQRLARWLLLVHDKAQTDKYKLSHAFLAEMLGCSRPALSRVAAAMARAGRIRSSRGMLHVQDFQGLEEHACECYRITKEGLRLIHS